MIPGLTGALAAAGVPVEVAGDEIPLAANPAVRPLLLALQVAARGCAVTPDEAQLLLTSPLGGMDSMAVRRLGRVLREAERAELAGNALPRHSAELTSLALRHPDRLEECGDGAEVTLPVSCRTCSGVAIAASRAARRPRGPCGTCGPERPGRTGCRATLPGPAMLGGGPTGTWTRSARCSMSPRAARGLRTPGADRVPGRDRKPADPRGPHAGVGPRGAAVRLLTAHRAKGLEWDLVVVAGVQEARGPTHAAAGRCWRRAGWVDRR